MTHFRSEQRAGCVGSREPWGSAALGLAGGTPGGHKPAMTIEAMEELLRRSNLERFAFWTAFKSESLFLT